MTLAATAGVCAGQQLIAGPNVNMGGGPAGRTTVDPLWYNQVYGDLSLQRQNEGSMACSSRNPATCLAAGNDYRLVDVPGVNDGKVTADSWLGLYWTRNGGSTWRSSLLPGWTTGVPGFNDVSPEGQASPIRGLEASADPTVRAGTHGLFYVSGIAFNRAGENASAAMSGGEGKKGVHFVSVFIDDNNTSNPDVPPRYLWTVITDSGTSGQFLDKPWLAVDVPRESATCAIPGDAGVPPTTIFAGTAYAAYATFLGEGNNPHSEIWVKKSTDCGQTWGSAAKLTASVPLTQSPMIAINPANGNVHVVWREFGLNGGSDRILTAKSTNFGKTFTKPVVIDNLGTPAPLSAAFDQYTLPNLTETTLRMARSNDYPAICIGTDAVMRVVYSKRFDTQVATELALPLSRIVLTTSKDGTAWSSPVKLDPDTSPGHQFQPSIACTGSKATAFWLDQRHDNAFWLLNVLPVIEHVLGPFVKDVIGWPPTHTIDSRAREIALDAAGNLMPASSIQVSRYQVRYDLTTRKFVHLQFNPWNLPLFASGRVPFNGDYPEIIAKNPFKPPVGDDGWKFNDFADESPVLHAVWTDNRDVLRNPLSGDGTIADEDFTSFGAPGTKHCQTGTLTWTRNQNLYTATLGSGLVMQAEGNAKRTPDALKHGYVIRLQNLVLPAPGALAKRFRLTFRYGTGAESFDWREGVPRLDQIDVTIPAFSAIARTVFIPSGSTTSFEVKAEELKLDADEVLANGLKGSTVIVPDPTAPVDQATANGETHDVSLTPLGTVYSNNSSPNSDQDPTDPSYTYTNPAYLVGEAYKEQQFLDNIFSPSYLAPSYLNPSYLNPSYLNPSYINPSYLNPSYLNPSYINPSYLNPSYLNPSYLNPSYLNPSYINPSYINPSYINLPEVTDSNYVAINTGNVTSGYDLKAMLQSLPEGAIFQLQVNRLYAEPSPGLQECALGHQLVAQSLASVTTTGGIGTATFSLAPKEFAIITLRVACQSEVCFDPNRDVTIKVTAQAPNCTSNLCTEIHPYDIIDHAPPVLTLPVGLSVPATGPAGAVVDFTASAIDLDVSVAVTCTPGSGSLFPIGATTVTCSAKDAAGNEGTGTFTVTVTNAPPRPDDQAVILVEDTPTHITLTANDVEGDTVAYKVWTLPKSGTLSQSGSAITKEDFNLTGPTVTYVPNSNFNGSDTFTFKAADYLRDSGEAVVTITVTPVNDPPVVPLTLNGGDVASGTTKTWPISDLASDVDVDSVLTIQQVTQAPLHGIVAITGGGTGIAYTAGTFVGGDTFTYVVSDGTFSASTTMTVTVTYGTMFLFNGLFSPYAAPPKSFNGGSSMPLVWQYTNGGQAIDSSYALAASLVTLTFTRLTWGAGALPPANCQGGTEAELVGVSTDYPGNSFFQYFSAVNPHPTYGPHTWQFNWQTGPPVTAGCYIIRVILDGNGNNNPLLPVPDAADLVGEFLIKLK